MSDTKNCPKCGSAVYFTSTLPQYECGSQVGDILTSDRDTFYQSDECRIREQAAEIERLRAEVEGLKRLNADLVERIVSY